MLEIVILLKKVTGLTFLRVEQEGNYHYAGKMYLKDLEPATRYGIFLPYCSTT